MLCAIRYHLHNLKNMNNTHRGVLLLVKACNFIKSNTPPLVFFTFLNCKNCTKSRKASHNHISSISLTDFKLFVISETLNLFVVLISKKFLFTSLLTLVHTEIFFGTFQTI